MYQHILLPTDGSELSDKAVEHGLDFAKMINARVTLLHVVPEFRVGHDEAIAARSPDLKKRFEQEARKRAEKMLGVIGKRAAAKGVKCATLSAANDAPFQQIIATAKQQKCDLIIMASHGRRGLTGILLGSETAKVLTHSTIPVLVVR